MRKARNENRYNGMKNYYIRKCVIGVDQSYNRCGISIAVDGELKLVKSEKFKGCSTKTDKRNRIRATIDKVIMSCLKKYPPRDIVVICERLRLFSSDRGQSTIRPDVIKPMAALIACIVDVAFEHGVEVWSVDTRSWKAVILGSSQPIFEPLRGVSDPQKFGSVRKVIELGFLRSLELDVGKGYKLDDDAADSACIALYGFAHKQLLKRET